MVVASTGTTLLFETSVARARECRVIISNVHCVEPGWQDVDRVLVLGTRLLNVKPSPIFVGLGDKVATTRYPRHDLHMHLQR